MGSCANSAHACMNPELGLTWEGRSMGSGERDRWSGMDRKSRNQQKATFDKVGVGSQSVNAKARHQGRDALTSAVTLELVSWQCSLCFLYYKDPPQKITMYVPMAIIVIKKTIITPKERCFVYMISRTFSKTPPSLLIFEIWKVTQTRVVSWSRQWDSSELFNWGCIPYHTTANLPM
jgi:hypothetical protein